MISVLISMASIQTPSEVFETTESPTHQQIVDAYVHRDQQFNSIPSEVVANAMTKLKYTPEARSHWSDNYVKHAMYSNVDNFLKRECNSNYSLEEMQHNANVHNSHRSYMNFTKHRQRELQPLVDAVDAVNATEPSFRRLRNFYAALTMEELGYLGW